MHKIGFGVEQPKVILEVPQSKDTPYPNKESIPVPTVAVSFYKPDLEKPKGTTTVNVYPEKNDSRIDPSQRIPTP